jgi:hypothetical protein
MSVPPGDGCPQAPGPNFGQPPPSYPGAPVPQQPFPGQQGPWSPNPAYPPLGRPPKGNGLKWVLGGVVVVLAIALAVTTTLLLRNGPTSGPARASETFSPPSDIASAKDTGPVSIITVEPTCTDLPPINNALSDTEKKGWGDIRKTLGPVDQWTPDQHAAVEETTAAMDRAAGQFAQLAKRTPHRVVRELYEQFIAYLRAYSDAAPKYTPADNYLADALVNAGATLVSLCNAITYGSAPLVTGVGPAAEPTAPRPPGDPANPTRFITTADATCQNWADRQAKFISDLADWQRIDPSIPASQWTPEQRAINEAAFPVMSAYADSMEKLGQGSGNPILEDFAALAAVYLRGLVSVGDKFVNTDGWLSDVSFRLASMITEACQAVGTK